MDTIDPTNQPAPAAPPINPWKAGLVGKLREAPAAADVEIRPLDDHLRGLVDPGTLFL